MRALGGVLLMRIVGGQRRGLRLADVGAGDMAAHLRPTPDRVREAIFNILASDPDRNLVSGARVLDLFAGTGALGLEALSRGAIHVTFVEDGAAGHALIRENIERMHATGDTRLYRRDATRMGPNRGAPFTLVFLDPPYGQGLGEQALASARDGGWITADAMIVWEENAPMHAPDGFSVTGHRRYGETHVTFLRADQGQVPV